MRLPVQHVPTAMLVLAFVSCSVALSSANGARITMRMKQGFLLQ
jgi:hypothetical protein